MNDLKKIVVLIDADNTQLKMLELVFQEISTHGRIVVKRAYGNWKKGTLKDWENEMKRLAIKPVQQFDYVSGKNATDIALAIDAMELLHSEIYDGFIIVSSDSDYTPLVIKLRESGVYVIGVGERKTPEPFRNSCDQFLFLENLYPSDNKNHNSDTDLDDDNASQTTTSGFDNIMDNIEISNDLDSTNDEKILHDLLKKAWETYQDDEEFVNISSAGPYIKRVKPDFDIRTYGFKKLPEFIKAFDDIYEYKTYKGKGKVTIFAYRCK